MKEFIRFLWKKSYSIERRLFLLSEIIDLRRRGYTPPSGTITKILRRPSSTEDYVNFLRFINPSDRVFLIDVGANIGQWCEDFLFWFPSTKVVAIEPTLEVYSTLVKRFMNDGRVSTIQAAVSNTAGKATLQLKRDSTLNSLETYNSPFSIYRKDEYCGTESVNLVRLDEIVQIPDADMRVLKIDVQGHEIETVEGAKAILPQIDIVICELSFVNEYVHRLPSFSKVTTYMEEAGLYPVIFQEYGNTISNHCLECDVIYVRAEHFDNLYLSVVSDKSGSVRL